MQILQIQIPSLAMQRTHLQQSETEKERRLKVINYVTVGKGSLLACYESSRASSTIEWKPFAVGSNQQIFGIARRSSSACKRQELLANLYQFVSYCLGSVDLYFTSGCALMNGSSKKLNLLFFISSMQVTMMPHGCGQCPMNLVNNILVIC